MKTIGWMCAAALFTTLGCKAAAPNKPFAVDSGFNVSHDGLAFANFADASVGLTATEMVRLFGADKVCTDTVTPCHLTLAATAWMSRANAELAIGRCEGLALFSQLAFLGLLDPQSFGAATVHDLNITGNDALQRELAYWFATELLRPTDPTSEQRLSAKDAAAFLKTALAPDAHEMYRIGMRRVEDGVAYGAHSVTAIAIADGTKTGLYDVRVYDSNAPDSERHILLDTTNDSWSYDANADATLIVTGDTTNANPLYLSPSTARMGTFVCPFCVDSSATAGVTLLTSGVQVTISDTDAEVTEMPIFSQTPPLPSSAGGLAPGLYVHVIDGMILLTNRAGSQSFSAGQFGYTASLVQPPVVLPKNPGLQFTPPPAFSASSGNGNQSKVYVSDADKVPVKTQVTITNTTTAVRSDSNKGFTIETTTPTGANNEVTISAKVPDGASSASVNVDPVSQHVTVTVVATVPVLNIVLTTNVSGSAVPFGGAVDVSGTSEVHFNTDAMGKPGTPLAVDVVSGGVTTHQVIADTMTHDVAAPTVGTDITVATSYSQANIKWGAATDDLSPVSALRYSVVRATTGEAIDTLAEATAITGADRLLDRVAGVTSLSVASLSSATAVAFAVIVEDVAGNASLYAPVTATTAAAKLLFVATTQLTGAMGGIAGADAACNMDASTPAVGHFKAFLADGLTRRACSTANCSGGVTENLDWVITPNTAYVGPGDRMIGTTDAVGFFPAEAPLHLGTTDAAFWSGVQTDWTSASNNCQQWTAIGSEAFGRGSYQIQSGSAALEGTELDCGTARPIICVEQ